MTEILKQALDNPIFPAIGLALAATAGALWVAAAWWAYRDASWRTGSSILGLGAAAWIVVSSPLLLPLSLGVYVLARPQQTAAQGRSRRLVEELVAQLDTADAGSCPGCDAAIDPDWLRCPACSTWLAQPCAHCGGWSARDLAVCPWCGSEERGIPAVEERQPVAASAVPRKTRRRQTRRQAVGVMAYDPRQPRGRMETLVDARPPARAGSR
jgi:RNA polymerase subunit RPABC4/transcription elongation factor Spt4